MAEQSKMAEKVQIVVETIARPSGLNQTIAALKTFENTFDRVMGKVAGISGAKQFRSFDTILEQVKDFQKKVGGIGKDTKLKPVDIADFLGVKLDDKTFRTRLSAFIAEQKKELGKSAEIFQRGTSGKEFSQRPFGGPEMAAKFFHGLFQPEFAASDFLDKIAEFRGGPARPTPSQVASGMKAEVPVKISNIEPEAQRQAERNVKPLPTPENTKAEPTPIPKAILKRKADLTKGISFEKQIDELSYVAKELPTKLRTELVDWMAEEFGHDKQEIIKNFDVAQKRVRDLRKGTRSKKPLKVEDLGLTYTAPMEPILNPPQNGDLAESLEREARAVRQNVSGMEGTGAYAASLRRARQAGMMAQRGPESVPVVSPPATPSIEQAAAGGFGMGMFNARRPTPTPQGNGAPTPPPTPPTQAAGGNGAPPPPRPTAVASPAGGFEGNIHLRIRGDQITAELIPPPIQLRIPGTMVQAAIEGQVNAGTVPGPTPPTAPGASRAPGARAEEETSERPRGGRSTGAAGRGGPAEEQPGEIRRKVVNGIVKQITQAFEPGDTVTTRYGKKKSVETVVARTGNRSPEEEFEYQVQQVLKDELTTIKSRAKVLSSDRTPERMEELAAETRASVQRMRSAFTSHANDLRDQATNERQQNAAQVTIDKHAQEFERRIQEAEAGAQAAEMRATKARQDAADKSATNAKAHQERMAKADLRREKDDERRAKGVEDYKETLRAGQTLKQAEARALADIQDLQSKGYAYKSGAPITSRKTTESGDYEVETHKLSKTEAGERRERDFTITREARPEVPPGTPTPPPGRVVSVASSPERTSREPLTSKGMGFGEYSVTKLKALTTYAGEAMILYGTLEEARKAMESMIQTGLETARLSQVFKGVGGSARDLINDVLDLAAIEGKTAKEAEDSAVSWARLGLTRAQANEAVRVSLQAANIAMIDAATATDHLQTITLAYGLSVKDLEGIVGSVNAVSQEYKVTQNQIFDALSRTASVAKQTGLPLEELTGILGVLISKTGQSGVVVGNTVKTLIASLSKLDTQKYLREQFHMEVTVGGGQDVKDMNEILRDLIVTYQGLNQMERNTLATHLLGAQQISRLAALFDSYTETQVAAANAQLRLNSAEETSAKIRATLASRLVGLRTELDRFFASFDQSTGLTAGLAEVTSQFTNVLRVVTQINELSAPDFLSKIIPRKKLNDSGIEEKRNGLNAAIGMVPKGLEFGSGAMGLETGAKLFGYQMAEMDKWLELLGFSSTTAEKRLASFDAQIRQSSGNIKANKIALDIYRMALDSLFKGSDEEIQNRIDTLSKLGTLKNPEQFKAQLSVAVKQGDKEKATAILIDQIEAAKNRIIKETQSRLDVVAKRKVEIQSQIKKLEGSMFGQTPSGQKRLDQLREDQKNNDAQIKGLLEEQDAAFEAANSSYEAVLSKDVRHLTFLETQKATLQAISDVYRGLSKPTPLDEHLSNISVLAGQVAALKTNLKDIDKETVRQEQDSARRGVKTEGGTALPSLRLNRQQTQDLLAETQAKLNAARLTAQNAVNQTRLEVAEQIARAQSGSFEVGETEIDRLKAKEAGLQQLIAHRNAIMETLGKATLERQSAEIMQAQQLAELDQTKLEIAKAIFNVHKEEYEFNKKLMMSGPAELLQRIIAQRIAGGRGQISGAQFMSLSPQMREMVNEQSALNRDRLARDQYKGPVATANQVLESASAKEKAYADIAAENMVKVPSAASIVNLPVRANTATVTATNVTVTGQTVTGQTAPPGQTVPVPSPDKIYAGLKSGALSMPGVPPQDWQQLQAGYSRGEIQQPPTEAPMTKQATEATVGATWEVAGQAEQPPTILKQILSLASGAWNLANTPLTSYIPQSARDKGMAYAREALLMEAMGFPHWTGSAYRGAGEAAQESVEGFTSPLSLATLGAGKVVGSAARAVIGTGFGAQAAIKIPGQLKGAYDAYQEGNMEEFAKQGVEATLGAGLAIVGLREARGFKTSGKPPIIRPPIIKPPSPGAALAEAQIKGEIDTPTAQQAYENLKPTERKNYTMRMDQEASVPGGLQRRRQGISSQESQGEAEIPRQGNAAESESEETVKVPAGKTDSESEIKESKTEKVPRRDNSHYINFLMTELFRNVPERNVGKFASEAPLSDVQRKNEIALKALELIEKELAERQKFGIDDGGFTKARWEVEQFRNNLQHRLMTEAKSPSVEPKLEGARRRRTSKTGPPPIPNQSAGASVPKPAAEQPAAPPPNDLPTEEVGETPAGTRTATGGVPAPKPSGASRYVQIGARILERSGVQPEIANRFSQVVSERLATEDLEVFRQRVLQEFQTSGLVNEAGISRFHEQPRSYEGLGFTPAQMDEQAANARVANQQAVEKVRAANAKRISELENPKPSIPGISGLAGGAAILTAGALATTTASASQSSTNAPTQTVVTYKPSDTDTYRDAMLGVGSAARDYQVIVQRNPFGLRPSESAPPADRSVEPVYQGTRFVADPVNAFRNQQLAQARIPGESGAVESLQRSFDLSDRLTKPSGDMAAKVRQFWQEKIDMAMEVFDDESAKAFDKLQTEGARRLESRSNRPEDVAARVRDFRRQRTLEASSEPTEAPERQAQTTLDPNRAPIAQDVSPTTQQVIEKAVQEFAANAKITIANAPNIPTTATTESLELGKANAALALFTRGLGESSSALTALTDTVNGLSDAMGSVISELDDMGERISAMSTQQTTGAAKLNFAQ